MQLGFFDNPGESASFWPRQYQREAVAAMIDAFRTFRRLCLVLAPGMGKTKCASLFLKSVTGRCLWLAGTDFLLDQACGAIEEVSGERTGLEQGKFCMSGERIVIASIQSLHEARLLRKPQDTFDWIVYDEAHGALAPTSRRILDHFSTARVLGLSATPFRLDKKLVVGDGGLFEKVVFERNTAFAISEGWLVPVRPVIREIKEIDLSEVRTHGGDLKLGDLEKQIIKAAAPIAHLAWEESNHGELPALIYTPGVASAKAVAATFRALAVERWGDLAAVAIDGDADTNTRRMVRREFGKGIRAIANCSLLTQGVDLPRARCVVLGRPTMSLALFQQMSLRGGRTLIPELPTREERLAAIAESEKPWFKLVDLAGNSGKHDLVSIADGLAADLSFLERRCLRKRLQANNGSETLDEAVVEAKKASADEVRRELEANEQAIAQAAAQAKITAISKGWDPFRKYGAREFEADSIAPEWLAQPPTAEQIVFLQKNRIPVKTQTRGTAAALQRQARKWMAEGSATINQRRRLKAAGIDPNQPYELASRLMDAIGKWGFQPKRARAAVKEILSQGRTPGED